MRKYLSTITGLTLIAISVFITVVFNKNSDTKNPKIAKNTKTITGNIVKNKTIPLQINSTGSLIAKNKIEIFSEVQGVLIFSKKDLKAGTYYSKDKIILGINTNEHFATKSETNAFEIDRKLLFENNKVFAVTDSS